MIASSDRDQDSQLLCLLDPPVHIGASALRLHIFPILIITLEGEDILIETGSYDSDSRELDQNEPNMSVLIAGNNSEYHFSASGRGGHSIIPSTTGSPDGLQRWSTGEYAANTMPTQQQTEATLLASKTIVDAAINALSSEKEE